MGICSNGTKETKIIYIVSRVLFFVRKHYYLALHMQVAFIQDLDNFEPIPCTHVHNNIVFLSSPLASTM
jgi:hypothetical protein